MILYHGTNQDFGDIDSDTYKRLQRDITGLYYQSSRYVYSFLDSELKTGRMK
ncbi:MAG: hypothetical protein IKI83_05355 [Prevotella sp.]|nr:hypothetical protein [Prevotella sp.]